MYTLRKPESEAVYQEYLKNKPDGCPFCIEVSDGKLWRIQPARFPYDAVYAKHDLLIPTRHISGVEDLELEEINEFIKVLRFFNSTTQYSNISYNFKHRQTVPGHLHFHLLKLQSVDL